MAYTNVWSSLAPVGGIAASTLDDEIRKARLDLEERLLLGVFNAPFTADPLVVRPEILGNVVGKEYNFHWSEVSGLTDFIADLDFTDDSVRVINTHNVSIPLNMPVGAVIKRIKLGWNPNTHTIAAALWGSDLTLGTSGIVSAVISSSSGVFEVKDSGAISHALATGTAYSLKMVFTGPGNMFFHSGQILYDVADCRITR